MYAVIMAGGSGTRFWPLSREKRPKQCLDIIEGKPLLRQTVERILPLIDISNILLVISENQKESILSILPDLPKENILIEPIGRNTAPCITFASFVIKERGGDIPYAVLPSDHYIKDSKSFLFYMEKAFKLCKKYDGLVTFGINPTFPHTGYGYLELGDKFYEIDNVSIFKLNSFKEKPNIETAMAYLTKGNYLWNSGMFFWKPSVILNNIKEFLPDLYYKFETIFNCNDKRLREELLIKEYPTFQNISIDFGVMEKAKNVFCIKTDIEWSDVGNWTSLEKLLQKDNNNNIIIGKALPVNSSSNIIYSFKKLIVTLGINDIIIAETEDSILVCPKDKSEKIKDIVEAIKKNGMEEYL